MRRLERINTDQVEKLAEISRECLFYSHFGDGTQFPMHSLEDITGYMDDCYNIPTLTSELQHHNTYFYFLYDSDLSEEPVGYLKVNNDDEARYNDVPANSFEVCRIYLLEKFLKKGLGHYLMQFSIDEAKKYGKTTIWLCVSDYNEKAIQFYKSWGYKQISTTKVKVGSQMETELIFARPVDM